MFVGMREVRDHLEDQGMKGWIKKGRKDLEDVGLKEDEWICVTQDADWLNDPVNTAMNLRFP